MFDVKVTFLTYQTLFEGKASADTAVLVVNELVNTYGSGIEDSSHIEIVCGQLTELAAGESITKDVGHLSYEVSKPALPNFNATVQPFRSEGYMVLVFEPEELKGVSANSLQEYLTGEGNDFIDMNREGEDEWEEEELDY